jgi:succinyl-CoA synthetase alpha subunit
MNPRPDIAALRAHPPRVICLGSHRGAIQSMLDFDFLTGRTAPSVSAIIASSRRTERYFFGPREVSLPVYPSLSQLPHQLLPEIKLFLNVLSGRRAPAAVHQALAALPNLQGGTIFAERLPERFALELETASRARGVWLLGGASIGLVIPGALKLGPIAGTEPRQLVEASLFAPGSVAVISVSGGITNEIVTAVVRSRHLVSFAASAGGERFPLITPADLFLAAEADPATTHIAYYGELGGNDEYELAKLLKARQLTKPVIAYIGGRAAELFPEAPQFGHAGALAETADESAEAKSAALTAAGATVAATFAEFTAAIAALPGARATPPAPLRAHDLLAPRRAKLLASTVSRDRPDGSVELAGVDMLEHAQSHSIAALAATLWLGRPAVSPELEKAMDFILRLLVDHGPYQAAAVNTITSARAGTKLVNSLAAGLLTIGPRFGGANNQAAATLLAGVTTGQDPAALIEAHASRGEYIAGIGHRKYSRHDPDPRVAAVLAHTSQLKSRPFTDYALAIEEITTRKRPNLILNVDGAIAATLLDLLEQKEGYSREQLQDLIDSEFFNAVFILSRSIGLIAHYFDQARLDEGLLRLGPDDVAYIEPHTE